MARKHLALAQFVRATASLIKDGECVSCGKDGYEPNTDCHTHAPWDMRNDDAVETLHGLISDARRLNSQGEGEVPLSSAAGNRTRRFTQWQCADTGDGRNGRDLEARPCTSPPATSRRLSAEEAAQTE